MVRLRPCLGGGCYNPTPRQTRVCRSRPLGTRAAHPACKLVKQQRLYRVAFINKGQLYEVYARSVASSDLYGFIEIEELVFGERSSVLIDPSEEKLAAEFDNVKRSFIPMHAVVRIDEVDKRGSAKMTPVGDSSNVTPFPLYTQGKTDPS